MSRSPVQARRAKRKNKASGAVVATNSLILVLPHLLFAPSLLPLFELHFASYGTVASWTPLERLGRVLVVYDDVSDATTAKREMDGFVWDDPVDDNARANGAPDPEPLRAFFGPTIPLPIPTSLSSALLAVPSTGKNFLISPPGSPPVGWEQIEEDAPNKQVWHDGDETEPVDLGQTFNGQWADELVRALRYLSVDSGDGDGDGDVEEDGDDGHSNESPKTQVLLAPSSDSPRPAVVVSTPPVSSPPSQSATPPPGATRISSVKATIESMLVKKRSFGDLRDRATASTPASAHPSGLSTPAVGATLGTTTRITPTARPPLAQGLWLVAIPCPPSVPTNP